MSFKVMVCLFCVQIRWEDYKADSFHCCLVGIFKGDQASAEMYQNLLDPLLKETQDGLQIYMLTLKLYCCCCCCCCWLSATHCNLSAVSYISFVVMEASQWQHIYNTDILQLQHITAKINVMLVLDTSRPWNRVCGLKRVCPAYEYVKKDINYVVGLATFAQYCACIHVVMYCICSL